MFICFWFENKESTEVKSIILRLTSAYMFSTKPRAFFKIVLSRDHKIITSLSQDVGLFSCDNRITKLIFFLFTNIYIFLRIRAGGDAVGSHSKTGRSHRKLKGLNNVFISAIIIICREGSWSTSLIIKSWCFLMILHPSCLLQLQEKKHIYTFIYCSVMNPPRQCRDP